MECHGIDEPRLHLLQSTEDTDGAVDVSFLAGSTDEPRAILHTSAVVVVGELLREGWPVGLDGEFHQTSDHHGICDAAFMNMTRCGKPEGCAGVCVIIRWRPG